MRFMHALFRPEYVESGHFCQLSARAELEVLGGFTDVERDLIRAPLCRSRTRAKPNRAAKARITAAPLGLHLIDQMTRAIFT